MTDAARVEEIVAALDRGERRVAEKVGDEWVVDEDAKQAILDYFRVRDVEPQELGPFEYTDKIPLKRGHAERGVRVVPGAVVRYGSFLGKGVIVMPGFVNIGAWVGPGTMVDTWATVGSCAQIGSNVHIAGGAGIGGVLEPVNARPVIVEDDAFIGSRAIVVEGVVVGEGAVIAPHVSLTASVPIIDVTGDEPVEHRGYVPPRSVVVPGTRPKDFPAGTYQVGCALIIGQRSESTDSKLSLNETLRVRHRRRVAVSFGNRGVRGSTVVRRRRCACCPRRAGVAGNERQRGSEGALRRAAFTMGPQLADVSNRPNGILAEWTSTRDGVSLQCPNGISSVDVWEHAVVGAAPDTGLVRGKAQIVIEFAGAGVRVPLHGTVRGVWDDSDIVYVVKARGPKVRESSSSTRVSSISWTRCSTWTRCKVSSTSLRTSATSVRAAPRVR